ncbi:type II secretion system GspH family protein [Paenibacillus pasadenensis]|uniref:type IV pilus modification PilV family protein n=1 Tax=Paenibacillus pasadenensis TaxID=217090 RepID=UPI00203B0C92|nr:type II secretion system protein [Paenibacillus pasadenensis]MCM3750061.1 type II secretion system GspH family protein [Paenibacillus pasadenensis]
MQQTGEGEQGFTLLEIMASIVILSIVALTLSGFFVQAMSYSKQNQNKTIAVHLARNALAYIQKEAYAPLHDYFTVADAGGGYPALEAAQCRPSGGCERYSEFVADTATLAHVLNPEINGVAYAVKITYQPELAPYLELDPEEKEASALAASPTAGSIAPASGGAAGSSALSAYLMAVQVEVSSDTGGRRSESVRVEGYLTDETIR